MRRVARPADAPARPPWTGFGSGVPDENVHRAGWTKRMGSAAGRDFLRRRPLKPFGGPLGGGVRVEML
jgi:hypothetical protein